jgi:hypothetical protein
MNIKFGKVFTSKFVGTGPSSYEKRIYRAAVLQRLRNPMLITSNSISMMWQLKSTNAHKCMEIRYKHRIPLACFGHSCGHPQGRSVTKDGDIQILQKLVNQCTDTNY